VYLGYIMEIRQLVFGFLAIFHISEAHVSLLFPPARRYNLDYLDSFRTAKPCGGMPKGDIVTTIPNGQKLKVEWHLGYAHRGGFKIELINDKGQTDIDFTQDFVGSENIETTSYEIDIPPDFTYKGILRLTRQAAEWKDYYFYSCADVEIVNPSDFDEDYYCDKFHTGDKCQFMQDCKHDGDCKNGGRCLQNTVNVEPKRECYCPIGSFGKNCEKKSPLVTKSYNQSDYTVMPLNGEDFKFMWKLMGRFQDTLEGVIVAKTTSYVAIGWRDIDTPVDCQKFPQDVQSPHIPRGLHSMDCQDIIVGKVKGDLSNIGDYYTRDRSTPRRDEFYGGKDDLTAAVGWEENGITTIMFRKPISSYDVHTDNDFQSVITLIWAHGQSGSSFYADDILKHHGINKGRIDMQGPSSAPGLTSCTSIVMNVLLVIVYFNL